MDRTKIKIRLFLLILFLTALFFSPFLFSGQDGQNGGEERSLFSSLAELSAYEQRYILETKDSNASPRPDVVVRMAWVEVNEDIGIPGKIAEGDRLVADLFDHTLEFIVDKTTTVLRGITTRARVEDCPYSFLIFSAYDNLILGVIELPPMNRQYRVIYDRSEESYFLYKIHLDKGDWLESGPPLVSNHDVSDKVRREFVPKDDPLEEVEIDVLVTYSPRAKEWAEEEQGNIHLVLFQAMERGQLVLDNSEVFITLNIVGFEEIDYNETNNGWFSEQDLINMMEGEEEHNMHLIHEWRDSYGADLVALFARIHDFGGWGNLLTDPEGEPDRCFSLTRVQQAADSFTFIHEIGHNMGAHHHKEQNVQAGPGLFDYSAGWRWFAGWNNPVCSVMTYERGKFFEDGRFHTRVAHFSNPDVLHNGLWVTGCAEDGDNARNLRETKHAVAAYRTSAGATIDCIVSTPDDPSGPVNGLVDTPYQYTTGGAACFNEHDVEYRFWWNEWNYTPWGGSEAEISFPEPGIYNLGVFARCAVSGEMSLDSGETLLIEISLPCEVSVPIEPIGFSIGETNINYMYYTGDSTCDCGAEVEYRFDWGDGSFSDWSSLHYATTFWSSPGEYAVRARARCSHNESSQSDWSTSCFVFITQSDCRVLGSPDQPVGPEEAETNVKYTYTTGGMVCNAGHEVEYTIIWRKEGEDTYQTPWSLFDSGVIEFTSPGTHYISSQARCSVNHNARSFYSDSLKVTVTGVPCSTSAPQQPEGPVNCLPGPSYRFYTGGAQCDCGSNVEYQFWRENVDTTKIYIFGWSHRDNIILSFDDLGDYNIFAQARCTYDNNVISDLSPALEVQVVDACYVNPPDPPSGPTQGYINTQYVYTTGGSACVNEHPVEYRLLIGKDEEYYGETDMTADSTFTLSFSEPGIYWLISSARCSLNYYTIIWNVEEYLEVTITERDPADLFAGGTGTEEDPYLIANAGQLYNMRYYTGEENKNLYFFQVADIDLEEYGANYDDGKGWKPIGTESSSGRFTAHFDGNGHTIQRLFINRPEADHTGLFGYAYGAHIENVLLMDVDVIGKDYVGGLLGLNSGSIISDSYVYGNILGSEKVGGLVGENFVKGSILRSDSRGKVKGIRFVGGLAGSNEEGGAISESYSTSLVYGNNNFGGLIGWNAGSIENSYASGDVSGISRFSSGIGGLVGYNRDEGMIIDSYSAGYVKSGSLLREEIGMGGFAGYDDGSISGCYYDLETSGNHDHVSGKPRATHLMKKEATFEDWNFKLPWSILENVTYPYLQRVMTKKEYSSRLEEYDCPRMMYRNVQANLFLTLRNTGTVTWLQGERVYLGAVGDSDPLADQLRVGLQHDVLPGQLHTFVIPLYNTDAGIFTTQWQMLKEEEFWFGQVFSTTVEVNVRTDVESMLWQLFE